MKHRHPKKKNHGRSRTHGERAERTKLVWDHPGSYWQDNRLHHKNHQIVKDTPTGEEIRERNALDWKEGLRPRKRIGGKWRRRNKQSRRESMARRGSSSSSSGYVF